MKRILVLVLSVFSVGAFAQSGTIKGAVLDENSQPIPFATIIIQHTKLATAANENGSFLFAGLEEGNYSIVVSSTGFKTEKVDVFLPASEELVLSIQLKPEQQALDEILITTNRRVETLDEVPSSVSVLTSQQIERLSQTSVNIAEVLNEIPGLAVSTNQTSNTGQTLRGRKMLVLIDGIPQSTPLRNGSRDINTIDPNVIERIEVIKGATAIYGNGADGGIINYITKKPKSYKRLESTTQISTDGSLVDIDYTIGSKISQTFSGQVDKLGYVASGNFRQTGVFRDANGEIISPTYGLGETNQYNLFGKLHYSFNDHNRIEAMYNYFSSNQNTEYINQPGVYGEEPAIGVIGEVLGVDQGNRYNHNGQITYDSFNLFWNTDLKLNLYFQEFQTVYGYSETATFQNVELGYQGGQSAIESSKMGARLNFKTSYNLANTIEGDILYGVDVLNDVTSQNLMDGRVWVPEVDMTNFAPYVQLKSMFADFVLKAGIRLENINIDIPNYTTIYSYPEGGEPSGNVDVAGGELKYNATTFNAGLRYNAVEAFKPFVSFSQSFSIADLGRTLRTATENTVSQISSEAVIANNYEVGFNSNLGRVRLNAAAFISTSELGATYREVNGVFEIARQPERVYGYEVDVDAEVVKNLFAGSSISYTQGELDSEDSGEYDLFMNGDRIPPLKVVSYLQYRITNRFDARLAHIYSGNRDKFEPNSSGRYTYGQGPVESFHLVNFTTNYNLTPNTIIGLGIENLLNQDYYPPISQWDARPQNYSKGNGARFNLSLTVNL